MREFLQLLACGRSFRYADDQSTAGVPAFKQISWRVTDLGDALWIGDAEYEHQAPDHVGVRTSMFNFVAGHCGVNQITIRPAESFKQSIDDLAAEPGVERDFDPGQA